MSGTAIPKQVIGLMPKVKGLKGLRPKQHETFPINSSGTTTFSPVNGNNQIVISVPAFKSSWLNVQRSHLRFKIKTNAGTFISGGVHPFNRLQVRIGNQVIEDIQGYSTIQRVMSNFDPVCKKIAAAHYSGDYRATLAATGGQLSDATTLKGIYENGTTIEHNFVSGILGRDFQEHYLPIGFMNASGGAAMEITLWLEDPSITCVRDPAGTPDYELSEVVYSMEVVEMPSNVNDKIDKELYSGGKVSIPFSTFRLHVNHITQAAQNAELSINESAQNLQTVYTTIRPQSLPAIVSYDASSNRTDNLMFLGGHGDHAVADTDAAYNQTAKVKSMQFSYDTMLFPQKRLEMSSRDAKAALVHALGSLDLWDGDAFAGSLDPSGKGYWDNSGVFAIVQNFKTSRDDYVNGLNSAATGAPLMLSLQLAKPAQVPLRVESFCKNDYTLNVTRLGQATVLNGSARESPVD